MTDLMSHFADAIRVSHDERQTGERRPTRGASPEGLASKPHSRIFATRQPGTSLLRVGASGSGQAGFTLVELLITVAIILTISAMAVPSLTAAIDAAKVGRAVGDVGALETEVAEYQAFYNVLPNTLADIGRQTLLDPWGNPYQYYNHAAKKGNGMARKDRFLVPLNSDYDLYSMGKDGKSSAPITAAKSLDDVIRASNGGYVGLASQF